MTRFILVTCCVLYVLSFWFLDTSVGDLQQVLQSPSFEFVFGTDDLGRSFFWIFFRGMGNSFILSLLSLITLFLLILGFLCLSRFRESSGSVGFKWLQALDSIPGVIWISLIMIVAGVNLSDPGRFILLAVLLGVNQFPRVYRSIRGFLLSTYQQNYLEGARAIGLTELQIFIRYVVPEVAFLSYPIWIQAWIQTLLSEGYLSFLGVGLRPTTLSLGSLMNRGWHYYLVTPYMLVLPSLFLTLALFLIRYKLRASLAGGPLKAQETDQ